MNHPAYIRAICFLMLFHGALARAQYMPPAPQRFSLPETEVRTGTNLKSRLASGDLPFDKRYSELTQEQKNQFKTQYQDMAADDEPPFPIDGLGKLYQPIIEALNLVRVEGPLHMEVEVDSTGKAKAVSVRTSPSAEITKVAAAALMFHTYKPAVCRGKPCTMAFPVLVDLVPR